jgi:hypothetical protein
MSQTWGPSPQPPPASQPQWGQTPPTPPRKKRSTGQIILLVIVGLFVIGGISNALSGGDDAATAISAPTTAASAAAPVTTVAPKATERTAAPTTVKPKPIVYKNISARQWALIAKSPDAHDSEHIIVYGQVKQFDSATGDDSFLADVDGVRHPMEYGYVDYPTNTLLYGNADALRNLVEGDLFIAKVRVAGSESYDTQIGGNTTVPKLQITSIKVTGTAD